MRHLYLLLIVALLPAACDPVDETTCYDDSDIISVVSTLECGWGGGNNDSLSITPSGVSYMANCTEHAVLDEDITCTEWTELVESFDLAEFNALNLNSCQLCVDGCDMSIAVKTTTTYNRIKIPYYLFDDAQEPDEVRALRKKIEKIRQRMRKKICG